MVLFWRKGCGSGRPRALCPSRDLPSSAARGTHGLCAGPAPGAAQACSQLFGKQNKHSQNNARGIEKLFLVLSRNGESPDQFAFFKSQLESQWQGQVGMDPAMESCQYFCQGHVSSKSLFSESLLLTRCTGKDQGGLVLFVFL